MLNVKQQAAQFREVKAMGEIALASEYTIVLDDYPSMRLLFKEFPVPIINPTDDIEVTLNGGQKTGTRGVARTYFTGSAALIDTVHGHSRKFIEELNMNRTVSKRPTINGVIYHGSEEDHTQSFRIEDVAFFGFDPIQADTENAQAVIVQGQCAYHYFGEESPL